MESEEGGSGEGQWCSDPAGNLDDGFEQEFNSLNVRITPKRSGISGTDRMLGSLVEKGQLSGLGVLATITESGEDFLYRKIQTTPRSLERPGGGYTRKAKR